MVEDELTPLQLKLETLGNEIGKAGLLVAILVFVALTIGLIWETMLQSSKNLLTMEFFS